MCMNSASVLPLVAIPVPATLLWSALELAFVLNLDVDLKLLDEKLVDVLWIVMDDTVEMLLTGFC